NGGGAFLIPYFIALILIGIPVAWIEWALGRNGGKYGHGSAPGILNAITRKPWAKYIGFFGIFGPVLIFFYYSYIESWLLGFSWFALTGELSKVTAEGQIGAFFGNYISLKLQAFPGMPFAFLFFLITFFINFIVIYFGIRHGIEIMNKFAMPAIIILGIMLLIRTLTIPNITHGLGYMWNPDFSKLLDSKVWFEAAGQIFFTLSVGIGVIMTYASYVRRKQDIALSSLTACAANELAEVVIGGTLIIPLAVVIYGANNVSEIAKLGTFGLGFQTMPIIFGKITFGGFFLFVWFALLFLAGVTSSVSILQPAVSFLEDDAGLGRRISVGIVALVTFVFGLLSVFGLEAGAVDEMDWMTDFCLITFALVETIIFGWIFGIDKGMKELSEGAQIKIPTFFRFVFKYLTPTCLFAILAAWLLQNAPSRILLKGVKESTVKFAGIEVSNFIVIHGTRLAMLIVIIGILVFTCIAWRMKAIDEKLKQFEEI
ncbi:MAG: sodium:calcium symporter, partial [Candidatus Nanoarchaeia archaeon]